MNRIDSPNIFVLDLVKLIDTLRANVENFMEHRRHARATGELMKR